MKKAIIPSLFFLITSCENQSESDLTNPVPEKATYSKDVKSIIDNNCIICHTAPPKNGAPMPLNSKLSVQDAIINKGLINRISLQQGDPDLMPYGGTRLPQVSIDIIIKWQQDGFQD
ncbi:hypothetical protein [Flavobacterium sp. H122]|uniref:hypothetical protein n=1 Tax=Flavobacterium sp. H122 TaxID=2529860 RepID=UPI0010AA1011|nr:hypothetical protein [Flavobacterium sp. H122]